MTMVFWSEIHQTLNRVFCRNRIAICVPSAHELKIGNRGNGSWMSNALI